MKRIFRLSTLAGAIVAAVLLTSLARVSPQTANAGPYGYAYTPGDRGYSGYGYGPYGYGGYTYVAPRAYVYHTYRSYGFGNGFGTGATYNGIIDHSYSGSRFYGQAPYNPYGYGPYGYGGYGAYGY